MNNILYKEVTSPVYSPKKKPIIPTKIKFIILIVILCLIPCIMFEFIYIPTTSMAPSLPANAVYLCNRVHNWNNIDRGDIVTFRTQTNDKSLDGKEIVKRIIGLPNDKILIDYRGDIYINNKLYKESYVKYKGGSTELTFTVPNNCYFLLGDNRAESFDSRYWKNPFLEKDKIISKVKKRVIKIKI